MINTEDCSFSFGARRVAYGLERVDRKETELEATRSRINRERNIGVGQPGASRMIDDPCRHRVLEDVAAQRHLSGWYN